MKWIPYRLLLMLIVSCAIIGCCKHEKELLAQAQRLSTCDNVDSLIVSWEYLREANDETRDVVGMDIAKVIFHQADSLFFRHCDGSNLDGAAKCLDVMDAIVSYFGAMLFAEELNNNNEPIRTEKGVDYTGRKEMLDMYKERLADKYFEQARSAERVLKLLPDDEDEQRLMIKSDSLAHKYNPQKY